MVWLGDALHNHTDLEMLDLHHTKIGDDDAIALAEGLKNNDNLRRLAMHNNRITDKGAVAIAAALRTNRALTLLSLSSNGIGDEGAAALGAALRVNPVLRRLDLYVNLIGDEGAVSIAQALEVNSALRILHLDNNRVGDRTALALAKSLQVNRGLSVLTMLYNSVRNDGAMALVQAVQESTSMHSFALGHNRHVIGEATEALAKLKADHLAPRQELLQFLIAHNLTDDENAKVHNPAHPDVALERYDHHGPALHSPYAAAVTELQAHTPDGLQQLQQLLAADAKALHSHDATAHLSEAQKQKFASLMHAKVFGKEEL